MTITVPMPPIMANRRTSNHWRAIYDVKRKYWAELDQCVLARLIPSAPPVPLSRIAVHSVMYLGGAMDDDNAMHRHKWIFDWLKKRKYISDDRRKNLQWEGLPEQVVRRDGNYRVELTLTPVEVAE